MCPQTKLDFFNFHSKQFQNILYSNFLSTKSYVEMPRTFVPTKFSTFRCPWNFQRSQLFLIFAEVGRIDSISRQFNTKEMQPTNPISLLIAIQLHSSLINKNLCIDIILAIKRLRLLKGQLILKGHFFCQFSQKANEKFLP